jgi:hypothetical protein
MNDKILKNLNTDKCLIMSYDPFESRPEAFMNIISQEGCANYRSPFYPDIDKFKPYNYLVILFVKAKSGGTITHWGIVDRIASKKVKHFDEFNSFCNIPHSLPGDKELDFRCYFNFVEIGRFEKQHTLSEFNLLKTGQPITDLRWLRNILYAELKKDIMTEIAKTKDE